MTSDLAAAGVVVTLFVLASWKLPRVGTLLVVVPVVAVAGWLVWRRAGDRGDLARCAEIDQAIARTLARTSAVLDEMEREPCTAGLLHDVAAVLDVGLDRADRLRSERDNRRWDCQRRFLSACEPEGWHHTKNYLEVLREAHPALTACGGLYPRARSQVVSVRPVVSDDAAITRPAPSAIEPVLKPGLAEALRRGPAWTGWAEVQFLARWNSVKPEVIEDASLLSAVEWLRPGPRTRDAAGCLAIHIGVPSPDQGDDRWETALLARVDDLLKGGRHALEPAEAALVAWMSELTAADHWSWNGAPTAFSRAPLPNLLGLNRSSRLRLALGVAQGGAGEAVKEIRALARLAITTGAAPLVAFGANLRQWEEGARDRLARGGGAPVDWAPEAPGLASRATRLIGTARCLIHPWLPVDEIRPVLAALPWAVRCAALDAGIDRLQVVEALTGSGYLAHQLLVEEALRDAGCPARSTFPRVPPGAWAELVVDGHPLLPADPQARRALADTFLAVEAEGLADGFKDER